MVWYDVLLICIFCEKKSLNILTFAGSQNNRPNFCLAFVEEG